MKATTIFAGVMAAFATGVLAVPAPSAEHVPVLTGEAHLDKRVLICDPRCVCNDKKPGELGWRSCCDVGSKATSCFQSWDCRC